MNKYPNHNDEWRWRNEVLLLLLRIAQALNEPKCRQSGKATAQPQADAAQGKPRRGGQRRVKKDEPSTEQKDTTERRRRNAGRE